MIFTYFTCARNWRRLHSLIIVLIYFFPIVVNAQINIYESTNREGLKLIKPNPYPPKVYPVIYLQIDTSYIKLDSVSIKNIQPIWIKKVVIVKEEKYMKLFEDNKPVLLIHPKKKYKKDLSELFDIN